MNRLLFRCSHFADVLRVNYIRLIVMVQDDIVTYE